MSFENDGRLFGLGTSTNFPAERLICLTIGTGLGSVFIDQGRIINNGPNIPSEGYISRSPFDFTSVTYRHNHHLGIIIHEQMFYKLKKDYFLNNHPFLLNQ
ncbi:hypothetical protein ABES02_08480 [Neobacillus pocheonensis]|uniref:hypothetical protein n=1 Tax=Neobacillus pocheonensis TaxID=363869 RepID=UPI003D2DD359